MGPHTKRESGGLRKKRRLIADSFCMPASAIHEACQDTAIHCAGMAKLTLSTQKKKKPSCCHLTCEAAYLTMYTSAVIFTRTGVIQLVLKTKKKKGIFLQKDDELKFSWRLSVEQEQPIGKISVFYFIFC